MIAPRTPRASGLTLIELLVVIGIIMLLSVAVLPTAYVAFAEREVSEAAGLVQGNFALTRDRAVGSGQPQGIRLMPDPDLSDFDSGLPLEQRVIVANRMLTLTTPPNYSEGLVIPVIEIFNVPPFVPAGTEVRRLAVYGAKRDNDGLPVSPTSWYYNIRQGEKLRIDGSGNEFTIAGPITNGPFTGNPERFINQTGTLNQTFNLTPGEAARALPVNNLFEVLYLVNGRDDNSPTPPLWPGVGYVDATFDGVDNNGDGFTDPGFNGFDDNGNGFIDEPQEFLIGRNPPPAGPIVYTPALSEYEREEPIIKAFKFVRFNDTTFGGVPAVEPLDNLGVARPITDLLHSPGVPITRYRYIISRRPSVATDAREYTLPSGAVIDLTTTVLGSASERSRVPIDPATGYVDLMFYPNGQVVPSTPFGFGRALDANFPLFFLWVAAREDVHPPRDPFPASTAGAWPLLPLPRTSGPTGRPEVLQGERRLVTISPASGHASAAEITEFGLFDTSLTAPQRDLRREVPYSEARLHQRTGR